MADTALDVQAVLLYDRWPGVAVKPDRQYSDMTATSVGHNVAAPQFPLGTKWCVYNNGTAASVGVGYNVGWSVFTYLKAAADIASAVAGVVTVIGCQDSTLAAGDIPSKFYTINTDSDRTTHETTGLIAVCTSTLTNSYYGWYWTGGVAPIDYVSGMTSSSHLIGTAAIAASAELMAAATAATGIGLVTATAGHPAVGIALFATD